MHCRSCLVNVKSKQTDNCKRWTTVQVLYDFCAVLNEQANDSKSALLIHIRLTQILHSSSSLSHKYKIIPLCILHHSIWTCIFHVSAYTPQRLQNGLARLVSSLFRLLGIHQTSGRITTAIYYLPFLHLSTSKRCNGSPSLRLRGKTTHQNSHIVYHLDKKSPYI